MFFRNKFGFRRYSILDAEVVNDEQAEFIANFGGYNIMAIATVRKTEIIFAIPLYFSLYRILM